MIAVRKRSSAASLRNAAARFHGAFSAAGFHSSAPHPAAMSSPYDEEMPTAPSEKVLKIVEDISGLTLLEAADMSLLLKKKLRIQNVPVMSMGMNVMQDMWYEALPPPIGPKRMIPTPSRSFADHASRTHAAAAAAAAKIELPRSSDDFSDDQGMNEEDHDDPDEDSYFDGCLLEVTDEAPKPVAAKKKPGPKPKPKAAGDVVAAAAAEPKKQQPAAKKPKKVATSGAIPASAMQKSAAAAQDAAATPKATRKTTKKTTTTAPAKPAEAAEG